MVHTVTFGSAAQPADPDQDVLGGKGANLVEMVNQEMPVPQGYVVTAQAYREFVERTGIAAQLAAAVDTNVDAVDDLADASDATQQLILSTDLPAGLRDRVLDPYLEFIGENRVAVRSSATAEDMAEASFAGQYTTFLNVHGADAVLDRIKDCWASLFNKRAIYYRVQNEVPHEGIDMAVVVQEMVDAEKSGVMFTSDPTTGEREVTIEAGYGLGEAIVSGEIAPDRYVVDRESGDLLERTIAAQEMMYTKDPGSGETIEKPVPDGRRDNSVLNEEEITRLVDIGERAEAHYGDPQDIEWCIAKGEIYVVQSRPITTTDSDKTDIETRDGLADDVGGDILCEGTGVASGCVTGHVVFNPIEAVKLSRNEDRDVILVREMTSPSDIQGMKTAVGVVTCKGGKTSHAAIVARELDKPTIVGCSEMTVDYDNDRFEVNRTTITKGDQIMVDAESGRVFTSGTG